MKFDHEWFLNRIKEVRPEDYFEYKFKDEYVNSRVKLRALHTVCGEEILVIPASFTTKRKTGCPKCVREDISKSQRKTQKEYESELPEGMIALTKYEGSYKNITVHCFFCDSTYEAVARDVTKWQDCSRCSKRYNRTVEDIYREIQTETKGRFKLVSDEYINAHTPVEIYHEECQRSYKVTMGNFRKGRRCPHCSKSVGENLIELFLEENNIEYETQKTFKGLILVNNLSYDFYLPEYNMLIEYQGEQHIKPVKHFGGEEQFKLQQKIDNIKRKYAEDNRYELLEIIYTDRTYDRVSKILKQKLFYS